MAEHFPGDRQQCDWAVAAAFAARPLALIEGDDDTVSSLTGHSFCAPDFHSQLVEGLADGASAHLRSSGMMSSRPAALPFFSLLIHLITLSNIGASIGMSMAVVVIDASSSRSVHGMGVT